MATFAARPAISGTDSASLARELLSMSPEEFGAAFKSSPMKRAKLAGLRRNAAVVLGNVGTSADTDVLVSALSDPSPVVRSHAASALASLGAREATVALESQLVVEPDASVRDTLAAALGALATSPVASSK